MPMNDKQRYNIEEKGENYLILKVEPEGKPMITRFDLLPDGSIKNSLWTFHMDKNLLKDKYGPTIFKRSNKTADSTSGN